MKDKRIIDQILVDGQGWLTSVENPIEKFEVNGEMAPVTWYRCGEMEYNGKYVVAIQYEEKTNER